MREVARFPAQEHVLPALAWCQVDTGGRGGASGMINSVLPERWADLRGASWAGSGVERSGMFAKRRVWNLAFSGRSDTMPNGRATTSLASSSARAWGDAQAVSSRTLGPFRRVEMHLRVPAGFRAAACARRWPRARQGHFCRASASRAGYSTRLRAVAADGQPGACEWRGAAGGPGLEATGCGMQASVRTWKVQPRARALHAGIRMSISHSGVVLACSMAGWRGCRREGHGGIGGVGGSVGTWSTQ